MSAQWPLITARLVSYLPTLPGWGSAITVYDGPLPTASPPKDPTTGLTCYATIGHTSDEQSGAYTIAQNASGFQWDENGVIHSELACEFGSTKPTALADVRAVLFAALNGVDGAVRADRRLGVLSDQGTSSFQVALAPVLNKKGTAMIARFVLTYFTVT